MLRFFVISNNFYFGCLFRKFFAVLFGVYLEISRNIFIKANLHSKLCYCLLKFEELSALFFTQLTSNRVHISFFFAHKLCRKLCKQIFFSFFSKHFPRKIFAPKAPTQGGFDCVKDKGQQQWLSSRPDKGSIHVTLLEIEERFL